MNRHARVFVAGASTLAGAALLERLEIAGFHSLVGTPPDEPDLTQQSQTEDFFGETRPEYVFLVAGKSGGIERNRNHPAELMLDNLLVSANVLRAAHAHGVVKLLYLASSCSYPRDAVQPLRVEALMSGPLEPTSEAYAMAKLAGCCLCRAFRRQYGVNFITAFPATPFGPHDDFSPEASHVIPGLVRRAHHSKEQAEPALIVWGTGSPRREFIYSGDLADACLYVMRHYDGEAPINLGTGTDIDIASLSRAVADTVGYQGAIVFDPSRPDGAPRKALDSSVLRALGWRPTIDFAPALAETYRWYLQHVVQEPFTHGCAAV
jgi:GDP-L-fucose synthase